MILPYDSKLSVKCWAEEVGGLDSERKNDQQYLNQGTHYLGVTQPCYYYIYFLTAHQWLRFKALKTRLEQGRKITTPWLSTPMNSAYIANSPRNHITLDYLSIILHVFFAIESWFCSVVWWQFTGKLGRTLACGGDGNDNIRIYLNLSWCLCSPFQVTAVEMGTWHYLFSKL